MRYFLRIVFILFLSCPSFLFSQNETDYVISIDTGEAWEANIFYRKTGGPLRPVIILDSSGEELFSEVWPMQGNDFKVNDNNKITFYDLETNGWMVMDSLKNIVDSVYCVNGYVADSHDFLALENGHYIMFAYDLQPYAMDTVVEGGDPEAIVEGLVIQEVDADHNLVFEWKSWDHFHITDNQYLPLNLPTLTFIHANAIDVDDDGHLLLSSRNLDEITKINRTTGEIIWRWGGTQSDITFVNDYPFTYQHSISSLGDNRYLLFDNGNYSSLYTGVDNVSRAVEYELDPINMTATKVWEFVHPDSLFCPTQSSVQRLPNGNTLIDFGNLSLSNLGAILTEVTPENEIVFQLEYDFGISLYRVKKTDWFFYEPEMVGIEENISLEFSSTRNLLKIFNLLGQEVIPSYGQIAIYIYDDGSVEKRFVLE
jgi:hypothetical protein